MKNNKLSQNSLLTKYSQLYERSPRSRVFAPLAESYRKIGMLGEAFNILRKGIQYHPSYTLGYIVLAHCYFDKEQYENSYNTLLPFVESNQENIRLQRLFANTCEKLGNYEQALKSYKILLLVNPKDREAAQKVKEIEDDLLIENHSSPIKDEVSEQYHSFLSNEDDWVQVDFNKSEVIGAKEDDYDQWNVVTPSENVEPLKKFREEIQERKFEISEHELDDHFYYEEYDNHSDDTIDAVSDNLTDELEDKPIITHTLVDLYCEQGHFNKAIEILESILELHPQDVASQLKMQDVKNLINGNVVGLDQNLFSTELEEIESEIAQYEIEDFSEEISLNNGQEELDSMLSIEKENVFSKQEQLKDKLNVFLSEIHQTAKFKNDKTV